MQSHRSLNRRSLFVLICGVAATPALSALSGCAAAAPAAAGAEPAVADAAPFLVDLAKQFLLDEIEDGFSWLAQKGISAISSTVNSDGTGDPQTYTPTGNVYANMSGATYAISAAPADDLDGAQSAQIIVVGAANGDQIPFQPRAAQALSATGVAMIKGGSDFDAMSADDAVAYLLPQSLGNDGTDEDGNRNYTYFATNGMVTITHDLSGDTPQELVCVVALDHTWPYDIDSDTELLA